MQDNLKGVRGKVAIEAAHEGVTGEDEARLDSAISVLYGVDAGEALEIHANYHLDRILSALVRRAEENGMKRRALGKKVAAMDYDWVSKQVAMGKLAEAAAVDHLFRQLSMVESRGKAEDRYLQFYG